MEYKSYAGSPGNPSPPSSIARSSLGTRLYQHSESGRSSRDEQFEALLSDHYNLLKRFLVVSLRDEKGSAKLNRARDKLLRLSPVQFQELSTDVFDELLRRQQNSRKTPPSNGVPGSPAFLLPKDTFHPKRNQARQKLSTLPPPRYRDLATDVFYELERRFPRFQGGDISRAGSPASMLGPSSRSGNGTPVNGSRGPSRMRRPSDASSIAGYSIRSDSRGLPTNGGLVVPPSPVVLPKEFGRPQPKTFHSNTIVPNKSTMVEDDETGDEDDDDADAFGLETAAQSGQSKKSAEASNIDKNLTEGYQTHMAEMQNELDGKDEEPNHVSSQGRNRSQAADDEKQQWIDLRIDLENKLSDAQCLNASLQSELERMRSLQTGAEGNLRPRIDNTRLSDVDNSGNQELERENRELRQQLREQEEVTEEVRREAQEFLREMRMLSAQSVSAFSREEELSDAIVKLEKEVQDWRNRYARTKSQLRGFRASSIGLTIQQDAAKYAQDSEFLEESGLVADVHVMKFQISIDELLRIARGDDPGRVFDYMKTVVVNVRRITQDIDEAPTTSEELSQLQSRLKSRVSATANNLITASKNYAAAKGLSPVSLMDAAASHLTTAVVELVRAVKIRPTSAGELEDDDDGNLPPIDATGFFPIREHVRDIKPPPQPFLGLRNGRASTDSSLYSPVNSPRDSASMRPWSGRLSRPTALANGQGSAVVDSKEFPAEPMGVGFEMRLEESNVEELRLFLDNQTANLVQNIQSLVSSIRSEGGITAICNKITSIGEVVGRIVSSTEAAICSIRNDELREKGEPILKNLSQCREQILQKGLEGRAIADAERDDEEGEREWRAWNQSLPPVAFEIARETKELVGLVESIDGGEAVDDARADDDFS